MSDTLVSILMILMWISGFMTAGMVYGRGPFWDGYRSIFDLSFMFRKKD